MAHQRTTLRLGTRASALALAQSRLVAGALAELHPEVDVELVPIVTRGDTTPGPLAVLGGKGLFTAELEAGLLEGSLDLAVHSLKDLPVELPPGLAIAAHPPREDPRDVLLSSRAATVDELAPGARVLTGSLRRRAQLLRRRGDLVVEDIRGNVDTRIRKWRESGAEGLVLAAAGLRRLGIEDAEVGAHPLPADVVVPAPGQGILAIECRAGSHAFELCRALDDASTARAARAERSVVAALGADCTLPLGAWARQEDGGSGEEGLALSVFLASRDARHWLEATVHARDPDSVAAAAVERLRRDGAAAILAERGA
ncbi:MAG TPA: hydroxymethylbilane synthase [Thermoanaerobaculia bacterium]|nr:hydroxymethylbilane synthase [Thermoanaerobaculia bacterium]